MQFVLSQGGGGVGRTFRPAQSQIYSKKTVGTRILKYMT